MTQLVDSERIDRMRAHVMESVADDVRTSTQRRHTRRVIGSTLAALVVVGSVGVGVVGGGLTSPSLHEFSSADSGGDAKSVPNADFLGAEPAALAAGASSAHSAGEPAVRREVIVTGSASVRVDDPRAASTEIAEWVEAHGGRVDDRTVDSDREQAFASLTVRVPADSVTATLGLLERQGTVTSTSVSKEDVTGTAQDLDARIKALKVSVARLETILEGATATATVIDTENALTSRQEQLEELVSQRSYLSQQVALATIHISLSSTERAETVETDGFAGGLRSGWNALVTVINHLVTAAGAFLPWAGVGLVLWGLVVGMRQVVRRLRRR